MPRQGIPRSNRQSISPKVHLSRNAVFPAGVTDVEKSVPPGLRSPPNPDPFRLSEPLWIHTSSGKRMKNGFRLTASGATPEAAGPRGSRWRVLKPHGWRQHRDASPVRPRLCPCGAHLCSLEPSEVLLLRLKILGPHAALFRKLKVSPKYHQPKIIIKPFLKASFALPSAPSGMKTAFSRSSNTCRIS